VRNVGLVYERKRSLFNGCHWGGGAKFSGFGRNGLTMGVIAKSLKNVQMWNKIRKKSWILS